MGLKIGVHVIRLGCVHWDSGQNIRHDSSGDIGQTFRAAVVEVSQLFMVHSQQVQNGRMQVVYVNFILDGTQADRVGSAVSHPAANTGPGQEH